jgi:hypothetical protein
VILAYIAVLGRSADARPSESIQIFEEKFRISYLLTPDGVIIPLQFRTRFENVDPWGLPRR